MAAAAKYYVLRSEEVVVCDYDNQVLCDVKNDLELSRAFDAHRYTDESIEYYQLQQGMLYNFFSK
jgi:hypothetical protein